MCKEIFSDQKGQKTKMVETASDQHELSLMELLRGFMECANSLGKTSFPPFEDKLWHIFLFKLKDEHGIDFYPLLECVGPFDWDGDFPKCRDFNVEMFGLRYVCFSKTAGGRVELDQNKIRKENPLLRYCPQIAHCAIKLAEKIPGFFEPR
ncbi:MAG TPA: hypothetical protein VJH05_02480 [Candidatus Paceibacterota bacterium]